MSSTRTLPEAIEDEARFAKALARSALAAAHFPTVLDRQEAVRRTTSRLLQLLHIRYTIEGIDDIVADDLEEILAGLIEVEEVRDAVRMAEGYGPDMPIRYWKCSPDSLRLDCTDLFESRWEPEAVTVRIEDQHGDKITVHCEPGQVETVGGRQIIVWEIEAIGPAA